jgi:membrane-associated protein
MDIFKLIETFSYPAIFAGAFFEGETIVLIGSYLAAQQKYGLHLPYVTLLSGIGAYLGHVVFFVLGRLYGEKILKFFPHKAFHIERSKKFFNKYGTLGIFISQYVYGVRMAFAVAIGISDIAWSKFLFLQLINCMIWSIIVTTVGAFFGKAIHDYLGENPMIHWIIISIFVLIVLIILRIHRAHDRISIENKSKE